MKNILCYSVFMFFFLVACEATTKLSKIEGSSQVELDKIFIANLKTLASSGIINSHTKKTLVVTDNGTFDTGKEIAFVKALSPTSALYTELGGLNPVPTQFTIENGMLWQHTYFFALNPDEKNALINSKDSQIVLAIISKVILNPIPDILFAYHPFKAVSSKIIPFGAQTPKTHVWEKNTTWESSWNLVGITQKNSYTLTYVPTLNTRSQTFWAPYIAHSFINPNVCLSENTLTKQNFITFMYKERLYIAKSPRLSIQKSENKCYSEIHALHAIEEK